MTGHRIAPTDEDVAILQGHVRRMLNWTLARNADARAAGTAPVTAMQHLHNTKRLLGDMLHFGPAP